MTSLLDLPNELLNHTFAYLDNPPQSESDFDGLPTFQWSSLPERPLKNISLVSHRLRTVVLGRLFIHLRAHAGSIKEVLQFVSEADLTLKIESIVIDVWADPFLPYMRDKHLWWCQLLDQIPATRIFVRCEPEAYNTLFNLEVNLNDSWAFKIPCQYIEFGQSQDRALPLTPCNSETGFFAAKPWQTLKINEGSSLPAYTSYEFFLKKHPSLLASLEQHRSVSPQVLQQLAGFDHTLAENSSILTATTDMFENLQMFSYTSVFPFYNHVDQILRCIMRMKRLRSLFMKLCPETLSTTLEDAIQAAKGHIDINDPWSEYVPTDPGDSSTENLDIRGVNTANTLVAGSILHTF